MSKPRKSDYLVILLFTLGIFIVGFGFGVALSDIVPRNPIDDFNAGAVILSSSTTGLT